MSDMVGVGLVSMRVHPPFLLKRERERERETSNTFQPPPPPNLISVLVESAFFVLAIATTLVPVALCHWDPQFFLRTTRRQ